MGFASLEKNIKSKLNQLSQFAKKHQFITKGTNMIDAVGGQGTTNAFLGSLHPAAAMSHNLAIQNGYSKVRRTRKK